VKPQSLHIVDKEAEAVLSHSVQQTTDLNSEREIKSWPEAEMEDSQPVEGARTEDLFHDACSEFETNEEDPVDWENDPLETGRSSDEPLNWTHDFFARFIPRRPSVPDDSALRRQIRDPLSEIEAEPPDLGDDNLEDSLTEWLRSVKDKVHPVEDFVAGGFGRHVAAWEELLGDSTRPSFKSVLAWLRNGIKPSFTGTAECDPKKSERVRRMLRKVLGERRAEEWLAGPVPHPVEFPNHRSFFENPEFGVQAVGDMLSNSTVKLYGKDERKQKVVNPLGVANLPKGRLVLDGGYVNAFTKHVPFKYETLREILSFLGERGFFSTWDFKAGYYHVLIHPRFRTYFGFRIGKAYFHYNALCFGWSEACYAYTLVTQEAARELRLREIPVSSYLDDGFTGDEKMLRCLWIIIMVIRFLTLLGAVFSLQKCKFWPSQEGDWLGFVVDSTAQEFRVSETKQEKVRATLKELAQAEPVTPRLLARVAGRIISMGPAVLQASLYSRPLFEAIQGKLSWDQIFPTLEAAKETARMFLEHLGDWNGRRWFPRRILLEAASDASDFGFGGTMKIAERPTFELVGSLSESEIKMSSTAREMLGFQKILQQAAEKLPEILRDSAILVIGDNQGAVAALNKFSSTAPDVAASLKEIFKLCSNVDFDVVAQWKPRDELALEDGLSRVPDATDWGLAPGVRSVIIEEFGTPCTDLFASDLWHVAPVFITPRFMPGCAGVDALHLDWRILIPAEGLAWIFPPVRAIPLVIQRIREFKTNSILIVPEASFTNWWLELHALRMAAKLEGPLVLNRSTDVCIPSRRVPRGTLNPALFKLRVFKITWP
jgi:hypothetical protein